MTYDETIEYLFNSLPAFEKNGLTDIKEGLDNSWQLDQYFDHPHRKYLTIHVAGTNGKGSCSHTLASILQECGYTVGLYTSPHLVDFRERIKVNGAMISKDYVRQFVDSHLHFFEPLHPSFFEITTAMAFQYFADSKVDIAVIEVGLGGRLDCTNIITPILSVITNISYDHTQYLGNTLTAIASEKAGIIKSDVPVVIGEANDETRPVFANRATQLHAPITFAEDNQEVIDLNTEANGHCMVNTRSLGMIETDLGGIYQSKNVNTVLCALKALAKMGYITAPTTANAEKGYCHEIYYGFKNTKIHTGLRGRWDVLSEHPFVVCDTGHNVAGWQYISKQINSFVGMRHIIFGMVNDKDIDTVISLLPKDAIYYFTKANNHRAISEDDVFEKATRAGLIGMAYPSVMEAYDAAMTAAGPDDMVFVGGSSYLVADFLSFSI